jgi:hypothetical protein
MENRDNTFPKGLIVKRPHENAPDFIKAKLSFKVDEFVEWLKGAVDERGWVNVDLKVSKEKKLYTQQDNWKPETKDDGAISADQIPF